MNILLFYPELLPNHGFGGTAQVVWDLGTELIHMGHRVWWLTHKDSKIAMGTHLPFDPDESINSQIPSNIDVVHFHTPVSEPPRIPYVVTVHENGTYGNVLDINSIFVSKDHAKRHGSDCFVYNGLNWDNYPKPDLTIKRTRFHFFGKASASEKNVVGAIELARRANSEIDIIGGDRFESKMEVKYALSPKVHFHGYIGGRKKTDILKSSKGLIAPVVWNEPFGLYIIESLYYGAPVFGTPYGSLPELIPADYGVLSTESATLVEALLEAEQFNPERCNEYVRSKFNSHIMAEGYLLKYETVISSKNLHPLVPECIKKSSDKLTFVR